MNDDQLQLTRLNFGPNQTLLFFLQLVKVNRNFVNLNILLVFVNDMNQFQVHIKLITNPSLNVHVLFL